VLCGGQVDATAALGDEDFYLLDTDAGVEVNVQAQAMGSTAFEIALLSGNDASIVYETGQEDETLSTVAEGSGLIAVRVLANTAGNYRLNFSCTAASGGGGGGDSDGTGPVGDGEDESDADWNPGSGNDNLAPQQGGTTKPAAAGCSQSSGTTPALAFLFLGMIGLMRRRRP
jgi:uncharacterized protein (TIGR03382 family)